MATPAATNRSFENFKSGIRAAIDGGDFVTAKRQSEMMLLLYPREAESHYLSARVKNENENKSEMPDALTAAERAVALDPSSFLYTYYCGALYLYFKLYELALPLLRKSTLMEPNAPRSQLELGECYFEIGKGELAAVHYRNALKLNKNGPDRDVARYKLAHCLVTSRQAQAADVLLKRLIKEKGKYYVPALSETVNVSKERLDSDTSKLVQAALLERADSPQDMEALHNAMGLLHENSGEYDKAFEHWTKSREIAKSISYNIRDHAVETANAKAFYVKELFDRTFTHADQTETPIFIIGMPRSGTTLTEQIIAAHSLATGIGELARWRKISDHFEAGFQS